MSETPIRDYRHEDFERLWKLDQTCFEPGIAYTKQELSYYLAEKRSITLVGERPGDNEVLGFILVHYDHHNNGRIITIDVHGDQRRTGLGSRLMQAVEERLKTVGCDALILEVAVDNLPALTFYKRHGYTVLKTIPRYYKNSLDALQMGKRLEPLATDPAHV